MAEFKVGDKVHIVPLDSMHLDYDFEIDRALKERSDRTIWTISEICAGKANLYMRQVRSRWVLLPRLQHVPAIDQLADLAAFHATEADIGRGVVYTPYEGAQAEDGVITSVNDTYVFVRYSGDVGSKATDPRDLRWLSQC